MASRWRKLLEDEIEQLEQLRELIRAEKECLFRMDRDALLRLTRQKEALAMGLSKLGARREGLQDENGDSLSDLPGLQPLVRRRNTLLQELRRMGRAQKEMIETQREQVGQVLSFLHNLRCQSSTYDCTGKYR